MIQLVDYALLNEKEQDIALRMVKESGKNEFLDNGRNFEEPGYKDKMYIKRYDVSHTPTVSKIVGYIRPLLCTQHDGNFGWDISPIYITKEERKKGYGSDALNKFYKEVVMKSPHPLICWVDDKNIGSQFMCLNIGMTRLCDKIEGGTYFIKY